MQRSLLWLVSIFPVKVSIAVNQDRGRTIECSVQGEDFSNDRGRLAASICKARHPFNHRVVPVFRALDPDVQSAPAISALENPFDNIGVNQTPL